MIRFGIIQFGSVNDTEASVFGYSVFTRFDRPLVHFELNVYSTYRSPDNQKFLKINEFSTS